MDKFYNIELIKINIQMSFNTYIKFFFLLSFLISATSHSQTTEDDEINRAQNIGLNDNDQFIMLTGFVRPISKKVNENKIKGSKYYEEDYKIAAIYDNDKMLHRSVVKFNAFNDEIEVKSDNDSYALLKKNTIKVVLDNYQYEFLENEGYFLVFNKDKKTSLLLKAKKKIREGEEAASTYGQSTPTAFVNDYEYYIRTKDGKLSKIKLKKKDIVNVLKDKKDKLEEFASEKKLNFKKEKDVVKIINYYNTL
ncbi:hypothetical protein J8281_09055 [Aquimarina sp. U1-2]|uniref:hypothetical protein n=1 Tax=Aquimarina sp. U1-2 TaxID=2823141 RepID=UPI001AEC9FE3|nr:hypothetical protein [Aquimarina sp. U1-2]MBP2832331.1 hypothetical protein [Aquimarina sp. U1-2]